MKPEDIKKLVIGGIIALIVGILNQSNLNNNKICIIIFLALISILIFRCPDSNLSIRLVCTNPINVVLALLSILFLAGYFLLPIPGPQPVIPDPQPVIPDPQPVVPETKPLISEAPCISTKPKEYSQLLSGVQNVCVGGNPKEEGVVPLKSNNSIINIISGTDTADPVYSIAGMALEYGNGRVVALGTSGFFIDDSIDKLDNKKLAINIFKWLRGDEESDIYISNTNDPNEEIDKFYELKNHLNEEGFTVSVIDKDFSERIKNIRSEDILVIFDPNEEYEKDDIDRIAAFVYNGGRLLLMGVGNCINICSQDMPINQIADPYCIEFGTEAITDRVSNCNSKKFPKFRNAF